MTTITIKTTPEVKESIRATAKGKGMTVTGYIMHLIAKDKEAGK